MVFRRMTLQIFLDPTKEDKNLIMIRAIAGEEVRKFGQNLKSFSEWKREVKNKMKNKQKNKIG